MISCHVLNHIAADGSPDLVTKPPACQRPTSYNVVHTMANEVISYLEMCGREGTSLQRGMNSGWEATTR